MSAVLTTSEVILDRLRKGPALSSELAALVALSTDSVTTAVRRLNDSGYNVQNIRRVGGRSCAYYRLVREPGDGRTCKAHGCQTILSASNTTDLCRFHLGQEALRRHWSFIDWLIGEIEQDCGEGDRQLEMVEVGP